MSIKTHTHVISKLLLIIISIRYEPRNKCYIIGVINYKSGPAERDFFYRFFVFAGPLFVIIDPYCIEQNPLKIAVRCFVEIYSTVGI